MLGIFCRSRIEFAKKEFEEDWLLRFFIILSFWIILTCFLQHTKMWYWTLKWIRLLFLWILHATVCLHFLIGSQSVCFLCKEHFKVMCRLHHNDYPKKPSSTELIIINWFSRLLIFSLNILDDSIEKRLEGVFMLEKIDSFIRHTYVAFPVA